MKVLRIILVIFFLSLVSFFEVFAQKQIEVISGQELLLYNKTGISQSSFANAASGRVAYFGASYGESSQIKVLGKNVATASVGSHGSAFRLADESDLLAACNVIKSSSIGCEINHVVKLFATPNDSMYGSLYGLPKIGAPAAWDISTGSSAVKVAVIDTGVDYNHPDLSSNILVNSSEVPGNSIDDDGNGKVDDYYGYDFVNNDSNPIDDNDHGTHVAGTIGAQGNNAVGVAGVNWQVGILPLKVLSASGSGSTAGIIQAIDYAIARGVHIINLSLGGPGYSQGFFDSVQRAHNAGILVVAAAGNSSENNDSSPSYPANFNLPNVISVAATTSSDTLASYSNYGLSTVHLAAPGSGILSTIPSGGYASFSGTSMACPHVAGAAALIKSANSGLSALQIKDLLLNNVDLLAGLSGKTITSGRLNLSNAIAAAVGAPPPSPTPAPTPVPTTPPSNPPPGDGGGGTTPAPIPDDGEEPEEPALVMDYMAVDTTYKNKKASIVVLALDADDYEVEGVTVSLNCPKIPTKQKTTDYYGEASFALKQTKKTIKCTVIGQDSYGNTLQRGVRIRALPSKRR